MQQPSLQTREPEEPPPAGPAATSRVGKPEAAPQDQRSNMGSLPAESAPARAPSTLAAWENEGGSVGGTNRPHVTDALAEPRRHREASKPPLLLLRPGPSTATKKNL